MKKQFILFSMLFFLFILTVACANNESDQGVTKSASESEEKVDLIISSAASLSDTMEVIEQAYKEEKPNVTLKFNFGGSGSLQQQILQGAPADLFFSAAEDKFDVLVEEGLIEAEDGLDLLGNEIVLIVSKGNESIQDFTDLEKEAVGQISLGTPETVPAGKYGKEALENMNLWEEIASKIVYAKDVRQVLSYVETGNVDAGLVYKTDALISDKVEIVASAESTTHTPIIYPVGMLKDSNQYEAAKEFYEFLQSDDILRVFEEDGFTTQ